MSKEFSLLKIELTVPSRKVYLINLYIMEYGSEEMNCIKNILRDKLLTYPVSNSLCVFTLTYSLILEKLN
jgi:hypothetical protein